MQTDSQNQTMWHFISEHISQATATCFLCQHTQQVTGGDSHLTYVVRDNHARYFVKLRRHRGPLQLHHEALGLEALSEGQTVATPRVICHGVTQEGNSSREYLVLSYLRFIAPESAHWALLGKQLAALHQLPQEPHFGWPEDNYIGLTPQCNDRYVTWSVFFSECRLGAMLEKLARQGIRWVNPDVFVTQVEHFLHSHQPAYSLVHGDLWSGNIGVTPKGPVLYDPAVHIADRETDLAMSELFGRLPPAFYQAYAQHAPLPHDYEARKPLYQLYHLLNHALLFKGHYLEQAKSAIIACQKRC